MLIIGLDLETTGLDVAKNGIVEIALVLWDTEAKIPIDIFTSFVKDDRAEIDWNSEEAKECLSISNIPSKAIDFAWVPTVDDLIDQMDLRLVYSDYIVACNGDQFDKPMLENFYTRYGMKLPEKTWIDMLHDVQYPKDCVARNLLYLAAYHGFINPFPHRALFDVMAMLKVLSHYDIDEVTKFARSPFVNVIANVSYVEKDLAKDAKFKWNPERKVWEKRLREIQLEKEKGEYLFSIRVEK